MNRLTALLVLWVGLVGAIAPAFACAMPLTSGDCCPSDAPSECRQAWAFERLATTSAAVAMEAVRTTCEPNSDARSPEPVVVMQWAAYFPNAAHAEFIAPAASIVRTDATLTYLKTGRLRL